MGRNLNINANIEKCSAQLENLLSAKSVKYSEWPNEDKIAISTSVGVYHFFEKEREAITSLYVVKAGFGRSKWSLLKRLNQQFQISQKNALIGKIAASTKQDTIEIKN